MKIKTWDLTGFDSEYESATQKMLWNAVRFMQENGLTEIDTTQYKNVYGVAINEGEMGKKFDEAMKVGVSDATGAMHQCATNHAKFIARNGYMKWYNELKEHRKDKQPYEYEIEFKLSLS